MSLSSSFTDFSLAELFQLIDQGRKSGCLTVCTLPDLHAPSSKSYYFYMWFKQGRIVAAAHQLNGQGLIYKIVQKGLAKQQVIDNLLTQIPAATPIGLHLKTQRLLSAEQLNLLFGSQLQQIRELFEIQKGVFKLDSKAALPWQEMTGISIKATEVALMALRVLKNWKVLADVLPDTHSAIQSTVSHQPQIHLNAFEWQLWEFANGSVDLVTIASQLNQTTISVQQAAFRLMLAGLVEEVPLIKSSLEWNNVKTSKTNCSEDYYLSMATKQSQKPEMRKVSTAFLQNLVGFLRSKA